MCVCVCLCGLFLGTNFRQLIEDKSCVRRLQEMNASLWNVPKSDLWQHVCVFVIVAVQFCVCLYYTVIPFNHNLSHRPTSPTRPVWWSVVRVRLSSLRGLWSFMCGQQYSGSSKSQKQDHVCIWWFFLSQGNSKLKISLLKTTRHKYAQQYLKTNSGLFLSMWYQT